MNGLTLEFISIGVGLVLLCFGAEWFVLASSSLALNLGVTPLLVGLTVVAYGTSVPELVVSCLAALKGQGDIVVGNVLGANIFNATVILGIAALLRPMKVKLQLVRLDAPLMVLASVIAFALLYGGRMGRLSGAALFAGLVFYTWFIIRLSKKELAGVIKAEYHEGVAPKIKSRTTAILLMLVAFGLLVAGANLMIGGGVGLARRWGVSDALVGLTIISMGTSLPELAITVTAAVRGEADIAIGNVIGSGIFRLLGVLAIAALLAPYRIVHITHLDFCVMIGISLLLTLFLIRRFTLLRWEGAVLLFFYAAYLYHLIQL